MNVRDILNRQKLELEQVRRKRYIKRDVVIPERGKNIIKVISGPRRAGKSFFAIHELGEDIGYVNFDDENLVNLENYDEIIETVKSIYNKPKTVFFDEIQNLPRWELFVNRLQRQGYELILSGSNANLLSSELATHLTGRYLSTLIFPFSFKEYLNFSGRELSESEIKARLNDYLLEGGYPEPLVEKIDRKRYLSTLFDSVIYKDIIKRYKPGYPKELETLSNYFISNFGTKIAYKNLTSPSGIGSEHTVKKYTGYLEEAFLIFQVKRFSFRIREQERANRKVYVIDNGLISAKSFSFSENTGRLYENVVAIELKKRELQGEIEFYYYSNRYEVDFVIKRGYSVKALIQVSFDFENRKTKEREIRGLLYASEELNCDNLIVITGGYCGEEEISWFRKKRNVKFVPLWHWLLSPEKFY
ncbi:MAG: ATP-binding protein [Caldiserica bacterium]|nr:MAG: ATP-binding protein [Caldisericota bacterium]